MECFEFDQICVLIYDLNVVGKIYLSLFFSLHLTFENNFDTSSQLLLILDKL